MPNKLYRTSISQAFWCSTVGNQAAYQPALVSLNEGEEPDIACWLDELFEGGLLLPEEGESPLTMLLAGPPGSGKTTLATEFCYRLARDSGQRNGDGLFSVYLSTDQETHRIIENAQSLGYSDAKQLIVDFDWDENHPTKFDINRVAVFGREKVQTVLSNLGDQTSSETITLSQIVEGALSALNSLFLSSAVPANIIQRLARLRMPLIGQGGDDALSKIRPAILVVDSLNVAGIGEREHFFRQYQSATTPVSKLVVFVLDSGTAGDVHSLWEYACDIVLRLDYTTMNEYYLRTVEVVKARYQSHIWGKHQLKIYKKPEPPATEGREQSSRMRRSFPYRSEGGIFIYPSIHYYLSKYKRRGPESEPAFAETKPALLGVLNRGLPVGRCTAFIGGRGGHKSHFGYLHLLHRIVGSQQAREPEEAALVVSLRDDEKMTASTLAGILDTEFPGARVTLQQLEMSDRLEILYYHPGYITPEEFFNRMFISVQRMKRSGRRLTVLFNSLDQITSRFPLCAAQKIFIPGIIESLCGEGVTGIFIAVDEAGQPAEQYGLLPMADLILSFYLHRFQFPSYFGHLNEGRQLDHTTGELRERVDKRQRIGKDSEIEAVVLQVVRFAGGQRAGKRGILELIGKADDLGLYERPGLHFTKMSSKHSHGEPVRRSHPGG